MDLTPFEDKERKSENATLIDRAASNNEERNRSIVLDEVPAA